MIRRPEIAGAAVDRVGNGNAPPFHSGHISVTLRTTVHMRAGQMTISRPYMYLGPGLVTPSPGLFLRSMNGGESKIEAGTKVAVRRDG